MTQEIEQVLTLHEVADALKVSDETVRKLCITGKLAWIDVGTGDARSRRRVRASTLAAFMQNERRQAIRQQMRDVRHRRDALRLSGEGSW